MQCDDRLRCVSVHNEDHGLGEYNGRGVGRRRGDHRTRARLDKPREMPILALLGSFDDLQG